MSSPTSDKRLKMGVSGPRAETYTDGVGVSGHGTHYSASYSGHTVDVKKGAFDMGVQTKPGGFKAALSFDLLSVGYSNPSGTFKPGVSFGLGGSFGVQDDPEKKRTTFSVFPRGGKTGAEFSVSHDTMEKVAKGFGGFPGSDDF
jgi:hypothetical protein